MLCVCVFFFFEDCCVCTNVGYFLADCSKDAVLAYETYHLNEVSPQILLPCDRRVLVSQTIDSFGIMPRTFPVFQIELHA